MWNDIVLRLRALFFRRQMDEELQEELDFHIEMQARKSHRHDTEVAEAERRGHSITGRSWGDGRDAVYNRHLRNGCVFGEQAEAGVGDSDGLGAQRKEVLKAALGRAFKLLAFGSAAGLLLGILASRVLALIVYQATPRDPIVLSGVVLAMLLSGLLATWIPAQRAISIDPLILLREE
jgi:hypothetical protein